jgi:aspartyl-tRNA(Asn)/glutamyl-tRNA(Gln) amidotransferase subunit A
VLGALTRTVADTRLMFEVMSGAREAGTTGELAGGGGRGGGGGGSRAGGRAGGAAIDAAWRPRVGVPRHYIATSPVEDEIARAFDQNLEAIAGAGGDVVELRPRGWAEGRMATFVVLYTEHHAAHRDLLRRAGDRYGRSARLYALQGAFVSAADYLRCRAYGERLRAAVESLFGEVDVIVMPTSPFVTAEAARRPGEHRQGLNTVFTGVFNLTGHPAVTVPCGVSALGIPIGLQLVGRFGADEALLDHAERIESVVRPSALAAAA